MWILGKNLCWCWLDSNWGDGEKNKGFEISGLAHCTCTAEPPFTCRRWEGKSNVCGAQQSGTQTVTYHFINAIVNILIALVNVYLNSKLPFFYHWWSLPVDFDDEDTQLERHLCVQIGPRQIHLSGCFACWISSMCSLRIYWQTLL